VKGLSAVLAVGAIVICGQALAEQPTGQDLFRQCNTAIAFVAAGAKGNTDLFAIGQCYGLISGVRDTMTLSSDWLPPNLKACFPAGGFTAGEGAQFIVGYLNQKPFMLQAPDTAVAIEAFRAAYPCSKG